MLAIAWFPAQQNWLLAVASWSLLASISEPIERLTPLPPAYSVLVRLKSNKQAVCCDSWHWVWNLCDYYSMNFITAFPVVYYSRYYSCFKKSIHVPFTEGVVPNHVVLETATLHIVESIRATTSTTLSFLFLCSVVVVLDTAGVHEMCCSSEVIPLPCLINFGGGGGGEGEEAGNGLVSLAYTTCVTCVPFWLHILVGYIPCSRKFECVLRCSMWELHFIATLYVVTISYNSHWQLLGCLNDGLGQQLYLLL